MKGKCATTLACIGLSHLPEPNGNVTLHGDISQDDCTYHGDISQDDSIYISPGVYPRCANEPRRRGGGLRHSGRSTNDEKMIHAMPSILIEKLYFCTKRIKFLFPSGLQSQSSPVKAAPGHKACTTQSSSKFLSLSI